LGRRLAGRCCCLIDCHSATTTAYSSPIHEFLERGVFVVVFGMVILGLMIYD